MSKVSVRQFERKFKQYFNMPPQQFIMKKRIYQACDMIRNGKYSFSEIALDLGFYDQSSFTSQFRKEMGITPYRYRRQFQAALA